jgi:AAA domain
MPDDALPPGLVDLTGTVAVPNGGAVPNSSAAPAIWLDDADFAEADIPRRPWIAPGFALRGAVTVLAGPPSAMKSSLMLAWACAAALGRDHGRFRPTAPGVVVVYNVEDDEDEQRRRLSALLRQFGATPRDIRGRVVRAGPASVGTLFHRNATSGKIAPTPAMDRLRNLIAERRPDMLIADPLAELHTAEENDNTALRAVIAEFRALAVEFGLAVVLVHHTRKGSIVPGDPDSARGASATIGAARIVLTLTSMSEDDAQAFGLSKDRKNRSRFVRLDDAKQNYAGIDNPQWFENMLYRLANGEMVPATVPWSPPDIWASIPATVANAILSEIDAGLPDGRRYSDNNAAKDRAVWPVVQRHAPSLSEDQARKIIATWRANDVLRIIPYKDPIDRKNRQGLVVNPARRPGAVQ